MHWMRLNEQPTLRASERASIVLATPGTSSSSTCPPQNHETTESTIWRRLPTITRSTLLMIFLAVEGTSLMILPWLYPLGRLATRYCGVSNASTPIRCGRNGQWIP